MTYIKSNVGAAAIGYITDILLTGKTLSRKLLEYCSFDRGQIVAFLPPDVIGTTVTNFTDANGIRRPQSIECLVCFITRFLKRQKQGLCLLENRYAALGDTWLSRCHSKTIFFNEEVYHLVVDENASRELVTNAVSEADTAMSIVGVCAAGEGTPSLYASSYLSLSDLEVISQNAKAVVFGAFDGSGFLIWHNDEAR